METYRLEVDRIPTDGLTASCAFFEWAETIPDALALFEDRMETSDWTDGEGMILWPSAQTRILKEGPAEARRLGFMVCETDGGWSALIPVRHAWGSPSWDDAFGACTVMRAQRRVVDGEGVIDLATHDVVPIAGVVSLDDFGWTVFERVVGPGGSVTYRFDPMKLAGRDSAA